MVELSRSIEFREGHVPGALWGVRTRLDRLRGRLPEDRAIVVAAPEEALARLAVPELRGLVTAPVRVAGGGDRRLARRRPAAGGRPHRSAGRGLRGRVPSPLRPESGVEAAMRDYLSWEIDLVRAVARDGDARFGVA